ncbi:histidine phosphatase family protein [Aestuariicoccus sp. MJ-SS9]|uniref:histidine phosphatase family protein n=1 Tax=Aestuariicoccus sp. MJ-SS9 TaxID=3079855 RepID=UPI00290CBF88|nr:histidine phosphatase family protein [Aestuariicoccus sp. MJ-SS9]MDU8910385.1 histidine phosphatase family protein [Aestuariicoccus sp. MJ-SS9]
MFWKRLWLALVLVLPGPLWANDWAALDQPGAFAIMRHALAPGTGDPAVFEIGDCATQRNLDARGRAQARAIGTAFKARGQEFDVVLTSQWCRCRDTAKLLALGPVEDAPALNSFFADFSRREAQTTDALALLSGRGDRPFVVTHQVNIRALTGRTTRSGEVLVVRAAGEGLEVLGAILIDP